MDELRIYTLFTLYLHFIYIFKGIKREHWEEKD